MYRSSHIERAIDIALAAGNCVKEVSEGWSNTDLVIYMTNRLTPEVRHSIETKEPSLKYWSVNGTPHNLPEEGFICDEFKVAVSFPRS